LRPHQGDHALLPILLVAVSDLRAYAGHAGLELLVGYDLCAHKLTRQVVGHVRRESLGRAGQVHQPVVIASRDHDLWQLSVTALIVLHVDPLLETPPVASENPPAGQLEKNCLSGLLLRGGKPRTKRANAYARGEWPWIRYPA